MSDTQPTPDPQPTPEPPAQASTGSGRFCLYDLSLLRFVGPVVESRRGIDKGLRVRGHDYEVREV